MTEAENDRRNWLIDKMQCAYIFSKVKGRKGAKRLVTDPDFPWTKEMAEELKILDDKFQAERQMKGMGYVL